MIHVTISYEKKRKIKLSDYFFFQYRVQVPAYLASFNTEALIPSYCFNYF